jgi:DNA-binding transcriptional MerR regulator
MYFSGMIKNINLEKLSASSVEDLRKNDPMELMRLVDGLFEKQFTIADIDIDHRSVLHWENEEILDRTKDDKDKWRKYSFIDYVWLRALIDIRSFGLPIPIIKKIKYELFHPVYEQLIGHVSDDMITEVSELLKEDVKDKIKKIKNINIDRDKLLHDRLSFLSRFGAAILNIILSKSPAFLLLTKTGEVGIAFLGEPDLQTTKENLIKQFETTSTLVINISNIIEEFFSDENLNNETYYMLTPLQLEEKEIMTHIFSGNVKNITVHLAEGKKFYTEILRKKPARNIVDQIKGFIAKNEYKQIVLETSEGKLIYNNHQ